MNSHLSFPARAVGRSAHGVVALFSTLVLLAACSKNDETAVTQAVAKVNKEEITELQLNQVLERQRGLKPDQVESASQRAVTALVDQEIVYQKAKELKLDREPRVVQGIEASRRELISRAYLERVAEGATPPTAEETRTYYDSKPALFKERHIYSLQELAVQATPEQRLKLQSDLKTLKTPAELEAYLKEKQLRVRADRSTVAAENIPLALLGQLAATKPGSGVVVPAADGVRVVFVDAVQDAPATFDQARPAIEAFLLNDRKRQSVEREMQALRTASKVEYFGKFKGLAASAPAPAASALMSAAAPAASAGNGEAMEAASVSKGVAGPK